MNRKKAHCILSLNSGSSSLKFALYRMDKVEELLFSGVISDIDLTTNNFYIRNDSGKVLVNRRLNKLGHKDCITTLFDWLESQCYVKQITAIGHRIVHGGVKYTQPHLITSDLIGDLNKFVLFAPEHLPQELEVIKTVSNRYSNLKQVACFDTAFHRTMPRLAQIYALPKSVGDHGGIRYGFHGLSYEYIIGELINERDFHIEGSRIIIAHLGNGASMAAIKDGKSVDTTMGFSPAGGLMMSTRSGDLDPGIILYLLSEESLSSSQVSQMVNHQAGLLGVSEISSDMKELLEKENNPNAIQAIELFCYQAKKYLGSLSAVLGGVDMLVFTGGIGENAPSIRQRICKDMSFLGIRLDLIRNNSNAPVISTADSPVTIRVMKTNEELMIARHAKRCVQEMKIS
jgi:acetate kinase